MATRKTYGIDSLVKRFGPMTLGMYLLAFREAEELTQARFAKKIGLSPANLCDLEKGRKIASPDRAARLAKKLGVPEIVLIQLAIQDALRAAKLNYTVELAEAA